MENELHPHHQYVSQLSCEVVFVMLVLQFGQLRLPVEGYAADLKVISPRKRRRLFAEMQVADAFSLVDSEEALLVSGVNAVAHVVAESRQGRGELKDVITAADIANVQVESESVFDVQTG